MRKPDITQEDLEAVFHYDPQTGKLWWRHHFLIRPRLRGTLATKEYYENTLNVNVAGSSYAAHRIIWCMMEGSWPGRPVLHRNGDGTDNRWSNLYMYERRQDAPAAAATSQPVDPPAPGW